MAHTVEQYAELLKNLLPPGQAFPREPGTNMEQVLLGLAAELARVERRGDELAVDVNPALTVELLSDWERAAGLPDKCAGVLEDTIQGRRQALLAKLTSVGGQSRAYFIALAASLGYQISITEFRPFRAGRSRSGDALTNGPWRFVWQVEAPATTIINFRAGQSAAGERLRSWGNDRLECKFNQLKPAHTLVRFAYGSTEAQATIDAMNDATRYANQILPIQLGRVT